MEGIVPVPRPRRHACRSFVVNASLWRGGLPPLGGEAAPIPAARFLQTNRISLITTAAQSNGGKPPRHRFHRLCIRKQAHRVKNMRRRFIVADLRFIK